MSAVPIDRREAQVIEFSIDLLSRGQEFRDIVRLFQSRKAQNIQTEPLKQALLNEVWRIISRDACL